MFELDYGNCMGDRMLDMVIETWTFEHSSVFSVGSLLAILPVLSTSKMGKSQLPKTC